MRPHIERALSICGLSARSRVLDVGCGDGTTVSEIARIYGCHVCGVDPHAPLDAGFEAFRLRAEDMDFDESFDLALAECSMSLFDNPEKALLNVRRALRASGRLILSDVYSRDVRVDVAGCELIRNLRTLDEILKMLDKAGFNAVLTENCDEHLKQLLGQMIFDGSVPSGIAGIAAGYVMFVCER